MISFSNITNFLAQAVPKINAGDIQAPNVSANGAALSSLLTQVYIWAGIVCVIVMIVGGFRYVTSNGDSGGIQSGKNTILYGVIGLIVIMAAATITSLIMGRIK